jgi:hypothetical protein
MMTRQDLLNAIVDDASCEMRLSYLRPDQKARLDGGLSGLEACRMLDDDGLLELRRDAVEALDKAQAARRPDWTWHRWRLLQIDWVLNVLSCALVANGRPPLAEATGRGMLKAVDILGVAS